MRRILIFFSFFVSGGLLANDTIRLAPIADATLIQNLSSSNFGGTGSLDVKPWLPSYSQRCVIKFDLGSISSSTIQSARIILKNTGTLGATRVIDVHELTSDWDENTVTWQSHSDQYSTSKVSSDTFSYPGDVDGDFDVTSSVQNMMSGTIPNYGWIIKDSNEDYSQNYWSFGSKESVSQQPELVIVTSGSGSNGGSSGENIDISTFIDEIPVQKDATVKQSNPSSNFGLSSNITVYPWGQNTERFLISFSFDSLLWSEGRVLDAAAIELGLAGTLGQDLEVEVYSSYDQWTESSITWNEGDNGGFFDGPHDDVTLIYEVQNKVSIPVTEVVREAINEGKGEVTFGIKAKSEDLSQRYWSFHSKESGIGPKLKLQIADLSSSPIFNFECTTEEDIVLPPAPPNETPPVNGWSFNRNNPIKDSSQYTPNDNTPVKEIRLNIHWFSLTPGSPGYPGNFTKTDDGLGNSRYNGYILAEKIVDHANSVANQPMNLIPGNNLPVLDTKIKFLLGGVFFHEDSVYKGSSYSNNPWKEDHYRPNGTQVINCYYQPDTTGPSGRANPYSFQKSLRMFSGFYDYKAYIDRGWGWDNWAIEGKTFSHEIYHDLGVRHTMVSCFDDLLEDTPDYPEIKHYFDSIGYPNHIPCDHTHDSTTTDPFPCTWNAPYPQHCSSNLMDYSPGYSLTPQQLTIAHWTIDNEVPNIKSCKYELSVDSIAGFSENKYHIAKRVEVSGTVLVDNANGLFVNCEEFEIPAGKSFEIKENCQFKVVLRKECQ